MNTVTVNSAAWSTPEAVPAGWVIVNAPRPLYGKITWQGPFRHGIFYAASPDTPDARACWAADDAWPVTFTTNDKLQAQLQVKLDEYGTTLEEVGMSWAEFAASYNLPWHEA